MNFDQLLSAYEPKLAAALRESSSLREGLRLNHIDSRLLECTLFIVGIERTMNVRGSGLSSARWLYLKKTVVPSNRFKEIREKGVRDVRNNDQLHPSLQSLILFPVEG